MTRIVCELDKCDGDQNKEGAILCCHLFRTGTFFSSPFLRMAPLEPKGALPY